MIYKEGRRFVMNMKKKIGICATLLAALLCAVPQSAQASGKIRSVDAYDPDGLHSFPNAGSALTVGDTVYVRFRLVNVEWDRTYSTDYENPWEFIYTGSLTGITSVDEAVSLLSNKPRLGLWVSGQVREAECVNWPMGVASDWLKDELEGKRHYTDLIFKYTVQPGDIALPLQLARADGTGPASTGVDATGGEPYYLKCNGEETLWKIVDHQTHSVTSDFRWGAADLSSDPDFSGEGLVGWEIVGADAENRDLDLNKAGVYVQAIDFDPTYSDEGAGIWRTIAQGSITADPGVPSLAIAGGAGTPMYLYVWTASPNIAEVVTGGKVEEVSEYVFGDGVTRKVGKLHIQVGDTSVPFYVRGTGAVNAKTELFVAATPTNIYNAGSTDIVTNFITRTIQVGDPLPPSISVTVDGVASTTVTADADYRKAKVAVNVSLSEAFSEDFDVPLKVTLKSNELELDPTNYVGLSESSVNDNTAWDAVLHVEKGKTTAELAHWMYANRGSTDTEVGLLFEVDTNATSWASSPARAFFTGKFTGATVVINRSTPEITEELTAITAEANAEQEITINVTDAYGELHEPCKYTVFWSNTGNDSPSYYTAYPNISATASGDLTFKVKYTQKGDYTSKFYVINQDGKASSKHDAAVSVKAAKVIEAIPYVSSGKFAENWERQPVVTLKFGDVGEGGFVMPDGSDWGYVFFVPRSEAASNLVTCAEMDGLDEHDWARGYPVYRGEEEVGPIDMALLDGDLTGKKMEYDIIVRTSDKIDEGMVVTSWSSRGFSFNVTNVAPNVTSVQMGTETLEVNGGDMGRIALGVSKAFSADTDEPSDVDFYTDEPNYTDTQKAFETHWDIKLGTSTLFSTNIFGPPSVPFNYMFRQEGTYTIEVSMRDKDSVDRVRRPRVYGPKFTFTVTVDAKPAIGLTPHFGSTVFTENDGGADERCLSRIDVNLTALPTEQIAVQLIIERAGVDDGNYPLPELSTTVLTFGGESPNTTNAWFTLRNLDGTDGTLDPGFVIRAAVTNTTLNSDNVPWRDVYRSTSLPISIMNLAPEINRPVSNLVTRAINEPFTINYTFKDFGYYDMYARGRQPNGRGATLYWTITGEASTNEVIVPNQNTYRGTFTTMFTSAGSKTVQLQVVDKDGGESEVATWYYVVNAAKQLLITPCGPGSSSGGNFAVKWTGQRNLGEGRVWATGGAIKPFEDFTHIYTYAPSAASAYAYAHGYSAGAVDNGTLTPGTDYAVTRNGRYPATGNYYTADATRDSFFYAWLQSTGEEGSGLVTTLLKLAPTYGADSNAKQIVPLPKEEKDATFYPDTILDAIFSKEHFPADNLGDLNGDLIPDLYAVNPLWNGGNRLYEIAGGNADEGGDVSFNAYNYNEDGDYLPSKSFEGGLPSTADGWTTLSVPFTAGWEIRGFHEGLNHRKGHDGMNIYVRGAWVSEPYFSEAETNAVAHWNGVQTLADFKATVPTDDPDYDTKYADWLAAFRTALNKDDSWIPENRSDPALWDTDGDSFPDGYEYYFWYRAAVGRMDGAKWVQMTGSKFDLNNIAKGVELSPKDIMDAFDPTKKANGDVASRDTDNDGLTDIEEFAMGTNPVHWDSDGDGMSDLWEVMRGMNPLRTPTDAEQNQDGDFMALHTTESTYAIVTMTNGVVYALSQNGANINTPLDQESIESAMEGGTNLFPSAVFGVEDASNVLAIAVFRYGGDNSTCVPKSRGDREFGTKPLDAAEENLANGMIASIVFDQPLTLIHDQVYNQFGFDPRTGWYMNKLGYVADRWNTARPLASYLGQTGVAINTRAYNCHDEYLVLKYRYETGIRSAGKDIGDITAKKTTLADVLKGGTTNPNRPFTEAAYTVSWVGTDGGGSAMEIPTYSSNNHGADTDEDGIPDGWELYVAANPNNHDDAIGNNDLDKLNLRAEYAGTDSCNAYKSVEHTGGTATIFVNHPGTEQGWFNKFFPTDPYDEDTDGDGLMDHNEGTAFIYGDPADDDSCCIRGGGLNPCTVDTDFDLLPDPWEHQYAGVVFTAGKPGPGGSKYGDTPILSEGMIEYINRNDSIGGTNGVASANGTDSTPATTGTYITMGMDGTFGPRWGTPIVGDAMTYYGPNNTTGQIDPRTGTKRNFDFDNDGLQNFQEYLVQTLRHFRYDDTETPLMGSYLPGGIAGSRKYVGFLPMQVWDGATFFTTARAKGFSGVSAWQTEGFRYEKLGYFARPPRAWDSMALRTEDGRTDGSSAICSNYDENGYRILMPPSGLSPLASPGNEDRLSAMEYVSTDPRNWDTDMDGMDDYYELFHGLNPLLGDVDVISEAYSTGLPSGDLFSAFCNAWTGDAGWQPIDKTYDAMKYPWTMGMAEADADGDGLRNTDEALLVNMPNPKNYHTDPTPLWMTDSSSKISYIAQYYSRDPYMIEEGKSPDISTYYWFTYFDGYDPGGVTDYLYAFEENEGYDTDHDWIPDEQELTHAVVNATDPLNANDPDRRQAMYFPGTNSVVASYSGNLHRRIGENYAMLRTFTVEAWVRPEDISYAQTFLTRVSDYPASTLVNAEHQVRANFRIAMEAGGRVYGQYDSDDAVPSGYPRGFGTTTVEGIELETNKWSHVALSFDGNALVLFVNGREVNRIYSNLIPANGLIVTLQEVNPNGSNYGVDGYDTYPSALLVGADAAELGAITIGPDSAWTNYCAHYKGWVDEVRVWDGARTAAQISADYAKRYSLEDISALRDEVYRLWRGGATHNPNDGRADLPAELLLHYSFQQLPSEVVSNYVVTAPSGFNDKVRDNLRWDGRNVDIRCGWWNAVPIASTVYGNRAIVPWLRNTCGMLPALDGSAYDSRYWSELLGGVTFPDEVNVLKFEFPNTANPYPYWMYMSEIYFREGLLRRLEDTVGDAAREVRSRLRFDNRTLFVGGADLLPLGGAFAKRCPDFWDGGGATDAWTATLSDRDNDGLPDWWEYNVATNYIDDVSGLTTTTKVNYVMPTGEVIAMSAWEAYLRDLYRGMLPVAGTYDPQYASVADTNHNGLPDWWETIYGVNTTWDDNDGDCLSNYAEYLIGECFVPYDFPRVSPSTSRSLPGQLVPDYFLRVGKLYLGEMFTDHDFMEDPWEDLFDVAKITRGLYDPWRDSDDDGWSNYAECRAGTNPTLGNSTGLDGALLRNYPVPTVHVTAVMEPGEGALNGSLVVQAYSSASKITGRPDATWTVTFESGESSGSASGSSSGTGTSSDTTSKAKTRDLGMNPKREYSFTLSPGSVVRESVTFDFRDPDYVTYKDGTPTQGSLSTSEWITFIKDRPITGDNNTKGVLVATKSMDGTVLELGSVDYTTGRVTVDFTKLPNEWRLVNDTALDVIDMSNTYTRVHLDSSYVRASWESRVMVGNTRTTLHLGESDSVGSSTDLGHLREGPNTFVVFVAGTDGKWKPGAPYGVVQNVDVGWSDAEFTVELTKTTPIMARFDLTSAFGGSGGGGSGGGNDGASASNNLTDRDTVNNGRGFLPNETIDPGTDMPANTSLTRIRLVRTQINHVAKAHDVLLDRHLDLSVHPSLTEADLLADGVFDLDWGTLNKANGNNTTTPQAALTNASYRIVIGEGEVGKSTYYGNCLPVMFVNRFEPRTTPTPTVPDPGLPQIVYAGRPTFRWSHTNTIDKAYPAFQLRIFKADKTTVVYDSGAQRAPARNANGMYEWTAPVYSDMVTPSGHVFSTTNNYYWSVSMLDAKFTTFSANEVKTPFRLGTSGNLYDVKEHGSIVACVKYFGPLTESITTVPVTSTKPSKNLIRVQAFTSQDFSGQPVVENYVTNVATIASATNLDANALLRGLAPGDYYVRAYIDTNGNGAKDDWESWGYACLIGNAGAKSVWAPKPVTVSYDDMVPGVTVYIEDADTDNDGFPDAWEMNKNGNLTTQNPISGNTFFATVNTNLVSTLSAFDKSGEALDRSGVIAALRNVRLMSASPEAAAELLTGESGIPQETTSVRIKSFSLEDGIELEVVNETTVGTFGVITFSDEATVQMSLMCAATPDFVDAEEVPVKVITIRANDTVVEPVTADELAAARAQVPEARFFKAIITKK